MNSPLSAALADPTVLGYLTFLFSLISKELTILLTYYFLS